MNGGRDEDAAGRHAETALQLMSRGPEHYASAIEHARLAQPLDQTRLVELLQSSGRLALAAGEHETAALLLSVAVEFAQDDPVEERPQLLFDLARATEGCGRIGEARELLSEVIRLAEISGDHDLLVDAAIRSALPPDWRAGDRRTAALLDLAERVEGDGPRAAAVMAARAMVEMRIPASPEPAQVAWVTRADVAQPLAERALAMTEGTSGSDRLIALGAWRSTHRSPERLARRLAVSKEAVDLAQRLLDHDRLVEACTTLAVDHLESADRAGFDRALAMVRWTAESDGNPRLRWWSATMSAGAALLDGDVDAAMRHRSVALSLGESHDLPGWIPAEVLLAAEMAFETGDEHELRGFLVPTDTPILRSPIARSTVALIAARFGDTASAAHHAEIAFRAVDEESSYLLCLTLLARAAVESGDTSLAAACEAGLAPWSGHVAVDASGWWCIGPVGLTLAELAEAGGRTAEAVTALDSATPQIESLGDARSLERARSLRRRLETGRSDVTRREGAGTAPAPLGALSDRERDVLVLIAQGHTNASIGAELAYSPSTIRADTVSIYRKLGVRGRAEAAALAVSAGLAARTD